MKDWTDVHRHLNEKKFITPDDVREMKVPLSSFVAHARTVGIAPQRRSLWIPAGIELDHRSMAQAQHQVLGGRAIFTGATALFLHGVIDDPPDALEVLLPLNASPRPRDGICFHSSSLFDHVRYRRVGDLRVAVVPWALADDAAHTDVDSLCRRIAAAQRLRKMTINEGKSELARRKRFPGRANLRVAYEMVSGELVHSSYERLARRLLRAEGHRPLGRPLTIELGQQLVAEIDVPFPDIFYGVEIDGPHHLLPEVASADRSRDRKLKRIDWEIDRFWWDEIGPRQHWFVQEVNKRIAERSEHFRRQ